MTPILNKPATILTLPQFCAVMLTNRFMVGSTLYLILDSASVTKFSAVPAAGEVEQKAKVDFGVLLTFKNIDTILAAGEVIEKNDRIIKIKLKDVFDVAVNTDTITFFRASFENFFKNALNTSPAFTEKAKLFFTKIQSTKLLVKK